MSILINYSEFLLLMLFFEKNTSPPEDLSLTPLRLVVFLKSYISVLYLTLLYFDTIEAYNLLDHSAHYFLS